MDFDARIDQNLQAHRMVLEQFAKDPVYASILKQMAQTCIEALQKGNKILLCGNGGSAADAQHIAAELSGRYLIDRPPLFVEALHVNTSYLTAVANDYSFAEVYRRAVEAKGSKGDVLIALSTSGSSLNILLAAREAKDMGMSVLGMTGNQGDALSQASDQTLMVPSSETPRIQEMHLLAGHILCELIEAALFPQSSD